MRNISGCENEVQQKQALTGLTPKTVWLLLRFINLKFQFFFFQSTAQNGNHAPVFRFSRETHFGFKYNSNPV